MQTLHELFPPNIMEVSTIRTYQKGETFTLNSQVGVIIAGVIGVDGTHPVTDNYVTLRLATLGDMLNIEGVLDKPCADQQYICESANATIAVMGVDYFKNNLNHGSADTQNLMMQNMLAKLIQHQKDLTETIIRIGCGAVQDHLLWAIARYQRAAQTEERVQLSNVRLAAHVGATPETVSRVLTRLSEEGKVLMIVKTRVRSLSLSNIEA